MLCLHIRLSLFHICAWPRDQQEALDALGNAGKGQLWVPGLGPGFSVRGVSTFNHCAISGSGSIVLFVPEDQNLMFP